MHTSLEESLASETNNLCQQITIVSNERIFPYLKQLHNLSHFVLKI